MNKIFLVLLVLLYSLPAMVPSCHAELNLAKGKPYTVTPTQNYPLSAPPTDTTALTDGTYSVGYFWTQQTTIGWQRTKIVEILIDLEQEFDIEKIVLNSARGKDAGVYYPAHIAAFVGPDREHLTYVGDLADDPENQPGSYQLKKFMLDKVGIRGRYVLLEVIPTGVFFFCDEIEVIAGTSGEWKAGNLTVEKAREFAGKILLLDREKAQLRNMAEKLVALVDKKTATTRLHEINQKITGLQSVSNGAAIETELLALRGKELTKQIPSIALSVQSINPWAALHPLSPIAAAAGTSMSLVAPKGGYDFGAVLLTNVSTRPMQVTTALDNTANGTELCLYQVPFIKSAAQVQVADPLLPVTGNINLRAGESRLLFVSALGKHAGNWITALHIENAGKVTSLPITIQVAEVALPQTFSLNSVNWGYLDFKLIRDRQQVAAADLLAHHTNVVVVPPAYLPLADPVKPLDFSRLESYLKLHSGADKVLLFMNLRSDDRLMLGGGYQFLGEEWKTAVKRWYEGARQAAVRAGFKAEQLYWYPFDEMNEQEIDQFIALAGWARSVIPGVKLYATLGAKNSERALPYLDIAQIHNNTTLLKNTPAPRSELWLYDTKAPAKSQSPYSYYRLMAWQAFVGGYKGIGFWAYADAGWGDNPGTAWDDFDGQYPDYAVIYEGDGNTIISSRRWEAWRMGIEDYELLTMYAQVKGDVVAKKLAQGVLDTPLETEKADEVRRVILRDLSR